MNILPRDLLRNPYSDSISPDFALVKAALDGSAPEPAGRQVGRFTVIDGDRK